MANIFTDALQFAGKTAGQLMTGDNLKDYSHASKLFVGDQYRLVPKNGFLFHVFFDINQDAIPGDPVNPIEQRAVEIGMLVKSVNLPKFNIDTKVLNAYNRPNIVQSKLKYEPVQMTFYDDSSDVVRNFWFDYFNYYYRDTDHSEELYKVNHKYSDTRNIPSWGFSPRQSTGVPYLNSIRIYSLHQKRFSEYVLINPIIKSFGHGEHSQGSNEVLLHNMTVEFETVLYYYGSTSSNTVKGFAGIHYDKSPSPLTPAGGGTRSILGPGGVMDSTDDIIHDLTSGNVGAALFKAGHLAGNLGKMDLKSAAFNELMGLGTSVLRGNNSSSSIFVPSLSSIMPGIGSIMNGIGSSGSNILAAATGVGAISLLGGNPPRDEAVTQASASENGAPTSDEDGLPYPDGVTPEEVQPMQLNGTVTTINDVRATTQPTNQSSIDSVAQSAAAAVNVAVITPELAAVNSDISFNQRQIAASREAEASFNNKIAQLKASGETDESIAVQNLTHMSNEEVAKQSDRLMKITELNAKASALKEQQSQEQAKL